MTTRLTHLRVRNLKRLNDCEIPLGQNVVFIGPNNSGKTTALQALALWSVGLNKWFDERGERAPEKRPGVTISRQELINLPVPSAEFLWRDLSMRQTQSIDGKQGTQNVRIDIIVDGETDMQRWSCGLEFDYANAESIYCRPLRLTDERQPSRMPVPPEAGNIRVAFLPPMSGLISDEDYLTRDSILDRIGQGRTAEILRNLCYVIADKQTRKDVSEAERGQWVAIQHTMDRLFGVKLHKPTLNRRGKIDLIYEETGRKPLDISSAGRGMLQTLLIIAFLYNNHGSVLLLDEPDAHLEILRQREIYREITQLAEHQHSQVIAASHSEVLLNEAADKDVVVAFIGRPHRIDDRGTQLLKSLRDIGFDQYYQAEQRGWVLYLEGSTDLEILRSFAERLDHPAKAALTAPFFRPINNQRVAIAQEHFYGLHEAFPALIGLVIVDHQINLLPSSPNLIVHCWRRNEIENYVCTEATLLAYARAQVADAPLLAAVYENEMKAAIDEIGNAFRSLKDVSLWDVNNKASDDVLKPIFKTFFHRLGIENVLLKRDYHVLVAHVPPDEIDREIIEKLDLIAETARHARPLQEDDPS